MSRYTPKNGTNNTQTQVISGKLTLVNETIQAPVNAQYVVTSADTVLTAERVTTNNTEVLWNTQTGGQLSADIGAIAQTKVTGLTTSLADKYMDVYGDGSDGSLVVVGTTH